MDFEVDPMAVNGLIGTVMRFHHEIVMGWDINKY